MSHIVQIRSDHNTTKWYLHFLSLRHCISVDAKAILHKEYLNNFAVNDYVLMALTTVAIQWEKKVALPREFAHL